MTSFPRVGSLLLLLPASLVAQTVFTTDFDAAIQAEITAGSATLTGVQGYSGLGPAGKQFGGQFLRSPTGNTVTLALANLPPHNVLHLDFLFAAIDSLDGAGAYPSGDFFKVAVDGVAVFRESFANATPSQIQTYVSPAGVELARHQDLGFTGPGTWYTDSAYYLGGDPFFAHLQHSASTCTIEFVIEGPGIQPLNDESWAIDELAVHVASVAQGSATPYGTSCGPMLGATSIPTIGQSVDLQITNLPAGAVLAFGCYGLSNTTYGSYVLPYPMDPHGMPGCWLVQNFSISGGVPFALANGVATSSFLVPNSAGYVGLQAFVQCWVIAPGSNAAGIVLSNGLRVQIGM